ncbi:MAG TPA: hypothetical protein VLM85_09390 [Polyangiaceae bacterium]|nr:hypothetical protein [Polyangiaceae bacterium]
MRLAALIALVGIVSCEAAVPLPAKSGWGASRAASTEVYPGKYPLVAEAERKAREAELARELPGWQVSVARSGFFAQAHTIQVPVAMKLAPSEIELAQHVIDRHYALFGLARPERFVRWHDGLYYISPIDDPRYGIALLHTRQVLKLAGHLWPGFAMRSSARKALSALLAPWLGRRFGSRPREDHPCDPVSRDPQRDCPRAEAQTITITADAASYVVVGSESGSDMEVREALALPRTDDMVPLDGKDAKVPRAVDARTGEELETTAVGPGMCESGGACPTWGWFQDERHLEFD